MKNIKRIFTIITAAFTILLASCSLLESEGADAKSTLVAVSIKNTPSTRTIFPELTLNSFNQIQIKASQGGTQVAEKTFTPAEFLGLDSLSWIFEVQDTMLESDFTFEMLATTSGSSYRGTLTKRLSALVPTELAFTLEDYTVVADNNGIFSIEFTVSEGVNFNATTAAWLEFDLYSDTAMTSKVVETITRQLGATTTELVSLDNLASGSYIYSARFYDVTKSKVVYAKSDAVRISSDFTTSGTVTVPLGNTMASTFIISSVEDLDSAKPFIDALPKSVTAELIFIDYNDSLEEVAYKFGSENPERKYIMDLSQSPGANNFSNLNKESENYHLIVEKFIFPDGLETIPDGCFLFMSGLKGVVIPSSVTTIEYDAFWKCSNLTDIFIPSSVTTIRSGAFKECTALTHIVIPSSVTYIGTNAFYNCSNLNAANMVFEDAENWVQVVNLETTPIASDVLASTILGSEDKGFQKGD